MAKKHIHQQHFVNQKLVSRHEKEQRLRQWLIIGTAAVLGLVVIVLGWGLYDQYVLRPKSPVATVYGAKIPLSEYQKLVQYRRWDYNNYLNQLQAQKQQFDASDEQQAFFIQYMDQQITQVQSEMRNLPTSVLDELIDQEIYLREAQTRGITVSDDEVTLRLEKQFGYDRNPPTPEPTPITATTEITTTPEPTVTPMTLESYQEQSTQWFETVGTATGFTQADFRKLIEFTSYREKVDQAIGEQVPTTAEQVRARHILVATLEEAEDILQQLKDGADFAELATQYSTDTSNKDDGGELGWFTRGQMVTEFDQAAFALPIGELSEPIETQFGYHIILVEDHQADRELDEAALDSARQQAVSDWLTAQRASAEIVRSWDSTMVPPAQ